MPASSSNSLSATVLPSVSLRANDLLAVLQELLTVTAAKRRHQVMVRPQSPRRLRVKWSATA